jgi:hypothetical protein
MSRITTGWNAIGKFVADVLYTIVFTILYILVIVLILLVSIIVIFTLAGLSGGISGAIAAFWEAIDLIVATILAVGTALVWCIGILGFATLLFLGGVLLLFIGDILYNVIENLFTPGAKTWKRFWSDIYYNGKYAFEGFVSSAKGWAARAKGTIDQAGSLITEGAGYIFSWIKSKLP